MPKFFAEATMLVFADSAEKALEYIQSALELDGVSQVMCEVDETPHDNVDDYFDKWTPAMWVERRRMAEANKDKSPRHAAWAAFLDTEAQVRGIG